jgi:RNA polymerase sigma-32 factor
MVKKFGDSLDDERDRAIWKDHLLSGEPASLVELGERFGVTKHRMGQLATRLKRGFRRFIIDELGPTTQLHWLFRED